MKKVILLIMFGVILLGFSGCFGDDKDEDKPAIIVLKVDKNLIAADGKESIYLRSEIRNKDNEVLTNGAKVEYYANEEKINSIFFKTDIAGEYKITARIGDLKSDEIGVKATKVIITDAGVVLKERESSYEVSDYKGTSKSVTIPEEINGKKIIKIADASFENKGIEEINFPDTITEIEANAFINNNLTKIKLPNSLEKIGAFVFYSNELTNIEFNNNLKIIENSAFSQNKLQSLNFPESLREIGEYAFSVNKLTDLKIPLNLIDIGKWAFSYNELTNIELPEGLKKIESHTFAYNNLQNINFPNSLQIIGEYAFAYNSLSELLIPSNVTDIGEFAFFHNEITKITLNEGLVNIYLGAFKFNKLESIRIPKTVTYIGDQALYKDIDNFIIRGFAGSAAETYAKSANINFEVITE